MLCENCQERNATSYCQINVGGKVVQKYLCQQCRAALVPSDELSVNPEFQIKNQYCHNCGTTLKDFVASGYVGCEYCYIEFYPIIKQALHGVQKEIKNMGKVPKRFELKTQIEDTEKLLEQAISNSDLMQVNRLSAKLRQLKGEYHD